MTALRVPVLLFLISLISDGFALDYESSGQYHSSSISQEQSEAKQESFVVPDIEQLAINQEIRDLLDSRIRHSGNRLTRVKKLHQLLFSENGLAIQYSSSATKTAQETFDTKSGDCLSLASLFLAAVRYIGFKANFQYVTVPRDWEQNQEFTSIPGHVNVVTYLWLGRKVEIDFLYTSEDKEFKSKVISDQRALAEYYNNIGVDTLNSGKKTLALAYQKKAVNTYPEVDFIWSNLGVLYKLNDKPQLAEEAYLKALELNRHNPSTILNIYLFYVQQGNQEMAKKYAREAELHARNNPYYLAEIALRNYQLNNLDVAVGYYEKAIKLKSNEDSFHQGLALTYFKKGEFNLAEKSMRLGQQILTKKHDIDRYQAKIDALMGYQKRM
jgi:Flp pilus assembly protein TadD